jgi:hypothetical protein
MVGLINITLSQQFEHVRTNFGALPDDYLEVFFRELNQLQDQVPFLNVTKKIELYMEMRAEAGVFLFSLDKMVILKTCFAFGEYQRVITRYICDHPQTPQMPPQPSNQSYEGLLAVLTLPQHLPIAPTLQLLAEAAIRAPWLPPTAIEAGDSGCTDHITPLRAAQHLAQLNLTPQPVAVKQPDGAIIRSTHRVYLPGLTQLRSMSSRTRTCPTHY